MNMESLPQTNRPHCSFSFARTSIPALAALGLLLGHLSVLPVHSGTVIDNFNDGRGATNSMALKDWNNIGIGGIGFATKYEQANSAVAVLRTNDSIVSLVNYVSGQTSHTQHWSVAATPLSSGTARRTQTRGTPSISVGSYPIWFSFVGTLLTPNGDMALTFNGTFTGSGVPNNGSGGLRIGLGSYFTNRCRGALGVGPLTLAASEATLANISDGVNGAITAAGFVPTNGTPGLVLGRIDYDPSSGYPRISIWYNPDVPNEASLPAPTLAFSDSSYSIVPTTITRIGYQNVRSATLGVQNELIDNVKVSDEPNAFDIVYRNAPLPIPTLNVVATVPAVSEPGPTNIVFTVTSDRIATSDLLIPYTLSGVATNGYIPYSSPPTYTNADYIDSHFDPNTQTSTLTIPAGQSSATVTIQVLDDTLPEATESVVFTITPSASSYMLASGSATATIMDNNDANVSVQYMFQGNGVPETWDTNLTASTATIASGFNFNSGAYNNSGYGPLDFPSPSTCFVAPGNFTPDNPDAAVAQGSFLAFQVAPVAGRVMTLTNLQFMAIYGNYMNQVPGATGAVVFVRSSLDNFTADLANFVLVPAESIFPSPGWFTNNLALGSEFAGLPGQVEFRLYIYDDSPHNQVAVRADNLFLGASTAPAPANVQQVYLTGTLTNAAEPAVPGQFTVTRVGDTTSALLVNYTVSGTASNGVDYVLLPGSVTIPAGQSSAAISVTPIDDDIPEPTETVVLTLAASSAYGILPPASATVYLADDGDIGGLVAWNFNENNNNAGSLSAIAAPSMKPGTPLTALNASAGAGLGLFGLNGGAGVGHGYGASASHSSPSAMYIRGDVLTNNAVDAFAGNDYVSFVVSPLPGQALTLTNFSAWVELSPGTNQTAWFFLRSSLDNFATDLGSITVPGLSNTASAFLPWSVPISMPANAGVVEFRVYVYSTRSIGADIHRLDDVILQGSAGSLPPGVQQVTAIASAPNAAEPNIPGAFTLRRYGSTAAALTVNYTIGGTASNGVDYATLGTSATFLAGNDTVVIPVNVIDDNRPEPTETVVLTLSASTDYFLPLPSSATVNIADNNDTTPVFTFNAADTNAYERVSTLLGAFTLNRVAGDTANSVTVNFTLGGTAVLGVDYICSATNALTFDSGVLSQTINIYPINNSLVDGDRTVVLNLQSSSGYILDPPTSGTVTIVDDETPPATVLWSDNFDAGTSAANYTIKAGSELGVDDYVADFNFDYSTIGVPPAPHSSGTTRGLLLNANSMGGAAGVNLYPIGQSFTNDYALRFDLFLSMDPGGSPDNELAFFGINQSGLATNWMKSATATPYTYYGEGISASICTRDVLPNQYQIYAPAAPDAAPAIVTSRGNILALFNSPPYATAGRPNNTYDSTNKTWVECELSQVAGVVTLKLNNNIILQYTNTTVFTNGNIFIGYDDPFASVGSANCFAVYDNVRVVALVSAVQPVLRNIAVQGGVVTISFTAGASDSASAFKLQSSPSVNGSYVDDSSAVLSGTAGSFQATTAANGNARFYRIRRQP